MPGPARAVTASMDREWLEDAARHDPIRHAYALWDLDYAPERVEFRLLRERGVPLAYLLIWRGLAEPVVHWVGPVDATALLAELPPRPLIAVVPEELGARVAALRGPATTYRVRLMARRTGAAPPPPSPRVRRLAAPDRPRLRAFAESEGEWVRRGYGRIDLSATSPVPETVWGAFDGERLVGVASTHVQLPAVWVLGGIYVTPAYRGRGLGRDLTAAAVQAADAVGAQAALYVRDDNAPALRAYETVGFTTVEHRAWIDAGGHRAP